MVTGSAWRKNNRRELRHSLGRFLAIVAIVALGVGFFAGLKVAQPAPDRSMCRKRSCLTTVLSARSA